MYLRAHAWYDLDSIAHMPAQKQMKYANDVRVKYVAIVGEEEMANEIIQLKNMETGEQEEVSVEELISLVKK